MDARFKALFREGGASFKFWLRHHRLFCFVSMLAAMHVAVYAAAHKPRKRLEGFHSSRPATPSAGKWVPDFFRSWRKNFVAASKADSTGLVQGIFLGDSSRVSGTTYALFQDAGVLHQLAASGFNCWVVAMLFHLLGAALLHTASRMGLPSILFLKLKSAIAPCCELSGAVLFFLWSDQNPPIARSLACIATKFIFWAFGLRAPFWRVLLVHYIMSLLFAPRLWFSASFQLTYFCLAGMLAGDWLRRAILPRNHARNPICGYLFTTLGAEIGAAPMTMIFFEEVNFTGLLTNFFVTPMVSFLVMPASLATMLLSAPGLRWGWLLAIRDLMMQMGSWSAKSLLQALEFASNHIPKMMYFY